MLRIVKMVLRQAQLLGVVHLYLHLAVTLVERLFDILSDALFVGFLDRYAIDDHLDGVFFCLAELYLVIQAYHHPVDHRAHIALVPQRLEHVGKGALFLFDQRRHDNDLGALGQLQHLFDDIRRAHRRDRFAALVTMLLADTRKEQTQIVVDLGNGTYRRTGVFRGGLLIDRDSRRKPFDLIDIGLADTPEKLTRIA